MPPDEMRECTIEKCDIFDFMAKYVGLSVLHPGGFRATEKLADECKIDRETRVLDIACGKGTSAIFLTQKFGCRVEGLENVMRVMAKYLFDTSVRKRLINLNTFINSNPQYFGYGIYITWK